MEGRKEVDVSRGEGKVKLAIHLLLDPKVSLHVAFVHSFVNPLLFVVLHKGCRWISSLKKVLAQTQARHPRSSLLQLLSVLGQGDSACLTPRCQVVEVSDGDDDDDGYVDGAKAVIALYSDILSFSKKGNVTYVRLIFTAVTSVLGWTTR